jgi:hypothetical protein
LFSNYIFRGISQRRASLPSKEGSTGRMRAVSTPERGRRT